jgi:hypothetical protein
MERTWLTLVIRSTKVSHHRRKCRGNGVIVLWTNDEITIGVLDHLLQLPRRLGECIRFHEECRCAQFTSGMGQCATGPEYLEGIDDVDLMRDAVVAQGGRSVATSDGGLDPVGDTIAEAGVSSPCRCDISSGPEEDDCFEDDGGHDYLIFVDAFNYWIA